MFSFILVSAIVIQSIVSEPLTKAIVKPLIPSESYTHKEHINEDNPDQYVMFWKLLPNDEIQFEIHCKTTGWCGLGISANGGMKDSDIALGWYDNKRGKAYLAVIKSSIIIVIFKL